jgi:hypothetical protein
MTNIMIAQMVVAFFESRPSPVMCRAPNAANPPPVPEPVVKPDGEIYASDVDQSVRWYYVVRGYNVGVVQGVYV